MTDDLHTTLDREAWRATRREAFGCSDLPALWIVLGWVSDEDYGWRQVPGVTKAGKPCLVWESDNFEMVGTEKVYSTPVWLRNMAADSWRPKKGKKKVPGVPRFIAEKAGLCDPLGESDAMAEGKAKEALLFRHSRLGQSPDACYAPEVKDWPEVWRGRLVGRDPWVMVDAVEPALRCTVEAWDWNHLRHRARLEAHELKADRFGNKQKPTWYWKVQNLGQATVLEADDWSIQYGPRWALADSPAFPDLADPIEFGPYPVTEADRTTIRTAVRMGWRMVEAAQTTEHPVTLSPQVLRESEG